MSDVTFIAFYGDQSITEWTNPQTFSNVFRTFKDWAKLQRTCGMLCTMNGKILRLTGEIEKEEMGILSKMYVNHMTEVFSNGI